MCLRQSLSSVLTLSPEIVAYPCRHSLRIGAVPHDNSVFNRSTPLSSEDLLSALYGRLASGAAAEATANKSIPMDTFKWIVSGLLGTLLVGAGWFLSNIQSDLRGLSKELIGVRVETAVTNTRLEELIAEFRRRNPH